MTTTEYTLAQLVAVLQEYLADQEPSTKVRLIVGGTAYPVDQVWFEPRQEGTGAICIGDDPR